MLFDRFWAVRTNWAAFPGFAGHPNPLRRGMGRGAIRRPCPHYGSTGNCYNMVPLPSCASWARGRPSHHIITIPSWWQNGCMRCLIKLLHLKHKWCRVGPWWVPYGTLQLVAKRMHDSRRTTHPPLSHFLYRAPLSTMGAVWSDTWAYAHM